MSFRSSTVLKEETLLITSSLTLGFNKFISPAARLVLTVPSAAILNQQPRSQYLCLPRSCKLVSCPLDAPFPLCPVYGDVLLVFVCILSAFVCVSCLLLLVSCLLLLMPASPCVLPAHKLSAVSCTRFDLLSRVS